MDEMDEIVGEFLVESYENLDKLDQELVSLEENPEDRARLASIFRTIHTIKGSSSFLGFSKLESVTHVGENLLSKLRDGDLTLTPERTSALLQLVDAVRDILNNIEKSQNEGDKDYTPLKTLLTSLYRNDNVSVVLAQETKVATNTQPEPSEIVVSQEQVSSVSPVAASSETQRFGDLLVSTGRVTQNDIQHAVTQQQSGDPRRLGEILVEQGSMHPQEVKETLKKQTDTKQQTSNISDNSIRVDVSVLENLMNLVGELVLTRNQILQYTTLFDDSAFVATCQRLSLITSELQEGAMKTRMQPIGSIWSKFPRIVRDLSLSCGKQIKIEMEGKDTELDKTIIEALKDPLTHIIRNSVDHGVESPQKRIDNGKNPEGTLFLRAYHEGGQVNIEISDDGGGIDPERVKSKAISKGLISQEQAFHMTTRELQNLIFLPGFSTAEAVTNISGRGVGMDVVRTNIEKIGGFVDINSKHGEGTTLKIKIPLTLAIIPALIVRAGRERYAVPQLNLLELVRLEGDEAQKALERVLGVPVYRLRGQLLPLVFLNDQLQLSVDREFSSDVMNIVVLQADERQFGLVVDEITDTQEIVVKPLGKHIKGLPVFAGATIMGDGRVALILDVVGIAQNASVISEAQDRGVVERLSQSKEFTSETQTLLLFEVGSNGHGAVPLAKVTRLEEFAMNAVEYVSNQEVVQYRKSILPVIRLNNLIGADTSYSSDSYSDTTDSRPKKQTIKILVCTSYDGHLFGIIVDRILDVVEQKIMPQGNSMIPGILGTLVINNKITQLLDIDGIVENFRPIFFDSTDVSVVQRGGYAL